MLELQKKTGDTAAGRAYDAQRAMLAQQLPAHAKHIKLSSEALSKARARRAADGRGYEEPPLKVHAKKSTGNT